MISPVTADTHKDYKVYPINEVNLLIDFIGSLRKAVLSGVKPPYDKTAFVNHTLVNQHHLKVLIDMAVTSKTDVKIPGNIIFWLFRGSTATNVSCPVVLPHICKVQAGTKELFLISSRKDWTIHREVMQKQNKNIQVSDHAKLQYLQRVLAMDVDNLLKDFPINDLRGNSRLLSDGRREISVGDFLYIMDENTCVTILNKSMVAI